jgi:hypothetical protein
MRGRTAAAALLLLAACGEPATAPPAAPTPGVADLSLLQRQFLARPVSAEAAAGRPATRQDLEEVRSWFGPGELEAVLAVANRRARARGEDTLRHCVPLCEEPGPASP